MRSAKSLIIAAFIALLFISPVNARADGDYQKLLSWMSGSFNSLEQSQNDSSYFDIRLFMAPIWPERSEAFWLYVEQAMVDYTDQPYRQRVYRLRQLDENTFESAVFTIEDPLRFAGAWRENRPLAGLTPDSLTQREGCAIILTKQGDTAFVGSTVGKKCESSLRGASYATSEVTITADQLYSWDRGFDSDDNQVWGAEKGGYIFKKIATIKDAKIIANLKEEMVIFDRIYIPALALTDQGKAPESIAALNRLIQEWELLKRNYYPANVDFPDWRNNLEAVGAPIELADNVINIRGDLTTTHEILENVKHSWSHFRRQYSIDYYLDYLNDFHEIMASITGIARGKKPDDLSNEDIEKIRGLYVEAVKQWKAIGNKRFDDKFFGFYDSKLELMNEYLAMESFALDKLGEALEGNDNQQILRAAIGIKPNFAKLYKLFGDFGGLQ